MFSATVHGCSEYGQCVNYPGGHECRCLPGYTGDGRDCRSESRTPGRVQGADEAAPHTVKLVQSSAESLLSC